MPQLQQIAGTYASQLFWLLLVFGVLYFGIARAMLPKVGRIIESRETKIAGDLAEAQSAQTRASEAQALQQSTLGKARGEAQSLVADATASAQEDNGRRLAALDSELAAKLTAAEARISEASATAAAEVDRIASEAAADIVARLTRAAKADEGAAPAVSEAQGA